MNPVRSRTPAISAEQLHVYRALVDGVVKHGEIPTIASLAVTTCLSTPQVAQRLDDLAVADWIGRSAEDELVALYPFSPQPTGVVVELDGQLRHTMCALDALGVAPMLGRRARITSTCVHCKAPVELTVTSQGPASWSPSDIVVTSRPTDASAYASCCNVTRFACNTKHAQTWIDANGMAGALILSLPDAFRIGERLFAACYTDGRSACHD